jgi:hypothetical protein
VHALTQNTTPARRLPGLKNIGIAVVAAALAATALYAGLREMRKGAPPAVAPAPMEMGHAERPALSADEERYAHALWKVHDQVRTAAVRMSFAGLSYKMGDIKKSELAARVEPITQEFKSALAEATKLAPPASLEQLHAEYVGAIREYEQASVEMRTGKGESDDHLIAAQTKSERAATTLLKVGDALWPGEHKPN